MKFTPEEEHKILYLLKKSASKNKKVADFAQDIMAGILGKELNRVLSGEQRKGPNEHTN